MDIFYFFSRQKTKKQTNKQTNKQTSKQANKQATKQATKQANKEISKQHSWSSHGVVVFKNTEYVMWTSRYPVHATSEDKILFSILKESRKARKKRKNKTQRWLSDVFGVSAAPAATKQCDLMMYPCVKNALAN